MSFPSYVTLVEVGARDGLQNEKEIIPTKVKIEFINQLSETGLSVIEATSFVSPKAIPQLADHAEVFMGISKKENVRYPVLIPNTLGLEQALALGIKEIAVFTSPSEQFNQHNIHCSVAESIERIKAVITLAKNHQLRIRGYLSCTLGCPYEGNIEPEKVTDLADKLFKEGCHEISLGDTIGVGTPETVKKLLESVLKKIPVENIAVHFHDTYGCALKNIYVALEYGISIIDSSVAGLGGCPYAPGATGNVATERVLYMLNDLGIKTGIDVDKLVHVGKFINQQLHGK